MKYTLDEVINVINNPDTRYYTDGNNKYIISSIDSNYIKELIEIEYMEKLNKFYNKYRRKEE
jgi:hypothetical protein